MVEQMHINLYKKIIIFIAIASILITSCVTGINIEPQEKPEIKNTLPINKKNNIDAKPLNLPLGNKIFSQNGEIIENMDPIHKYPYEKPYYTINIFGKEFNIAKDHFIFSETSKIAENIKNIIQKIPDFLDNILNN